MLSKRFCRRRSFVVTTLCTTMVLVMWFYCSEELTAKGKHIPCGDCPVCPDVNSNPQMNWPKAKNCRCPRCDVCIPIKCPECEKPVAGTALPPAKVDYPDVAAFLKRYDHIDDASILNRDSPYVSPVLSIQTDVKV